MNKAEFQQLADKITQGSATDQELALYSNYLNQLTGNGQWNAAQMGAAEEIKQELLQRIHSQMLTVPATAPYKLPRWISVAAAILFVMLSTLLITRHLDFARHPDDRRDLTLNDIVPGTNRATLKLANGKSISLSESKNGLIVNASKFIYNDGTEIRDNSKVSAQYPVTITTPLGGQYQITLPDGTVAQMNAGSSLTFPASFAGLKERAVQMTGEIYFTVIHDSKKPFRVISGGQVVEDIGTAFNINAYSDEGTTKTTLVEGSAKVFAQAGSKAGTRAVTLTPGKQSAVQNGTIQVTQVDPALATDWKNGDFIFQEERLRQILLRVSRWYNVKITYDKNVDINQTFSGQVSRSKNISEILKSLQSTGQVKFKIEERKVYVSQ